MSSNYFYEPLPFSAAEVEAITGLDPAMQRDWRRKKLVQRRKWSGLGTLPQELAEMVIVQALRDEFGLHLDAASEHAQAIAPYVLWFALTNYPAFDFDGPREERTEFRRYIEEKDKEGLAYLGEMVGAPSDSLLPFSVFREGKFVATGKLDEYFNIDASPDLVGGIVLRHDVLGRRLFEKIKRPIYIARPRRSGVITPKSRKR